MHTIYINCIAFLGGAFLGFFAVDVLVSFDIIKQSGDGIYEVGIFNAIMAAFFAFSYLRPGFLDAPSSVFGCVCAMAATLFATLMFNIYFAYSILLSPNFTDASPLAGDEFDVAPILLELALFCGPMLLIGFLATILAPFVTARNARQATQDGMDPDTVFD